MALTSPGNLGRLNTRGFHRNYPPDKEFAARARLGAHKGRGLQESRSQGAKVRWIEIGGLCGLVLANTGPSLGPVDVVDDPLPGSVVDHIYATGLYR